MPALLRYPGSAGAQSCQGRSSLDRACAPGGTWQLSGSTDRQDQPNRSVHASRGTSGHQPVRQGDDDGAVARLGQGLITHRAAKRRPYRMPSADLMRPLIGSAAWRSACRWSCYGQSASAWRVVADSAGTTGGLGSCCPGPMAGIGIIRCGRASPGTGSGRWRPAGPAVPRRAHLLAGTFPVAV